MTNDTATPQFCKEHPDLWVPCPHEDHFRHAQPPATGLPCSIEPALSQHEYAVSYCETHDQPADQCQPPATGLRDRITELVWEAREKDDPNSIIDRLVALAAPDTLAAPDALDVETLAAAIYGAEGDPDMLWEDVPPGSRRLWLARADRISDEYARLGSRE